MQVNSESDAFLFSRGGAPIKHGAHRFHLAYHQSSHEEANHYWGHQIRPHRGALHAAIMAWGKAGEEKKAKGCIPPSSQRHYLMHAIFDNLFYRPSPTTTKPVASPSQSNQWQEEQRGHTHTHSGMEPRKGPPWVCETLDPSPKVEVTSQLSFEVSASANVTASMPLSTTSSKRWLLVFWYLGTRNTSSLPPPCQSTFIHPTI